jgi:uncharacterized membrane protein YraQ (UPF0718 family)
MVDIAQPLPRDSASWRTGLIVLGALGAVGALLHFTDPERIAAAQNFVLVFGSLLIEAMPFILIGALVSAFIEVFVPARVFEKLTGLPRPLQLPVSALAGLAFPVCECGSVPVARRLVSKGLAPSAAVTFMLAAPILNPVVLTSTFVAYRGRDTLWPILLGRAGLGLVAAMAVGWVVANHSKEELLRPVPESEHEHEHEHSDSKPKAFFSHLAGDFVFMGRFLVLGAAVAAILQTFIPQSAIGSIAGTPGLDLIVMMGLAFLLSLCSESDAFVAASFVQFGVGAQLAFLVFGPMLDTKLGILYTATFSPRFFRTVFICVAAVTLAGTLWIEVLFG